MDDRPRNLKAMLVEAKDTSELMVDLAYTALFFDDGDMADEVLDLEVEMSTLVHDMRSVAVLAVRNPREAEAMSSVLQLISAIERIANDAVDISKIVQREVGIPRQLVAELATAEEVSHRVVVSEGSHLARRPLADVELPVQVGLRVVALHRGSTWMIEIDGETILQPGDVLFLRGARAGIERLRELVNAPVWMPPRVDEPHALTELDRAVETLVEMKNLSETAVGLAYSSLVLRDLGLAGEVIQLEDRLDRMKDSLQTWVLRSAADDLDPSHLRGLLQLAEAAEDIGDQAQQMVWLVERKEELHPIIGLALGDTDDVVVQVPVAAGSDAEGRSLRELDFSTEPGFHVLAIRRGGRYVYRPRGFVALAADDQLIASGPEEGTELLAARCGHRVVDDEDTGQLRFLPLVGAEVDG
ncbi:MAG: TrkA C-terminal domain-containing protein [Actinomycetota bacterium]